MRVIAFIPLIDTGRDTSRCSVSVFLRHYAGLICRWFTAAAVAGGRRAGDAVDVTAEWPGETTSLTPRRQRLCGHCRRTESASVLLNTVSYNAETNYQKTVVSATVSRTKICQAHIVSEKWKLNQWRRQLIIMKDTDH